MLTRISLSQTYKAVASVIIAAAFPLVVEAHHSFAMFEMNKTVILKGTVRSLEWTNPHAWVWLYVTEVDGKPVSGKDGQPAIWGLESAAPGELTRWGWNSKALKPGEKVTVTARPLKDGRNGGSLGKVSFDDGRTLGSDNPGRSSDAAKPE